MADDIFQPKRRPLNSTELNEDQNSGAKVRAALSEEDATATPLPNPVTNPDSPIKMEGQMPPQFLQMLQNKGKAPKAMSNQTSEYTPSGNENLDSVIAKLKKKTGTYEKITLPSKGKFYDGENGPLDGVIHIRPMTGEEEQILATPRYVKKGEAMNMIFNKCIQEEYDSANFLVQDRTFILIYLRGISYTPQYDVEVKCPSCDKKFAHTIDLNLENKDCPDNFSPASLKDTLPSSELKFSYRLSTGRDEQDVQIYRDRKIKNFDTAGTSDDTLLYRTALMVNDIEGITEKYEIQTVLKNLPVGDLNYLRSTVTTPPFGVETKVGVNCPSCLADFEIELPLESGFFFPARNRSRE